MAGRGLKYVVLFRCIAEEWLSGRRHSTRNRESGKLDRGFKSHLLRFVRELEMRLPAGKGRVGEKSPHRFKSCTLRLNASIPVVYLES